MPISSTRLLQSTAVCLPLSRLVSSRGDCGRLPSWSMNCRGWPIQGTVESDVGVAGGWRRWKLSTPPAEFTVLDDAVPAYEDVDAKLLELAARSGARLVTTDYNLSKAAELRGITVLNPSLLGEKLKPIVSTGESLTVSISKAGKGAGQGVAYLDDGTMVVVEDAADAIGAELEVVVTSTTRTAVGRMLFARPV